MPTKIEKRETAIQEEEHEIVSPFLRPPATLEQIEEAEAYLGISLPQDYKVYIHLRPHRKTLICWHRTFSQYPTDSGPLTSPKPHHYFLLMRYSGTPIIPKSEWSTEGSRAQTRRLRLYLPLFEYFRSAK